MDRKKILPFTRSGTGLLDPAFERALFLAEADERELRAVVPQAEACEPKFVY